MIVEIGHFALILAACVALLQGVMPLTGTATNNLRWQLLARPAAITQFLLLALAYGVLTHGALSDDFSIKYIAGHSNSLLPIQYKVASVWGGHEGSLLLWVLMLSGWTVAVALFSRSLPLAMVARVIGVLGLISAGFLAFVLLTSSPFERLFPAPLDGKDLNPLLQDPGLVIHPRYSTWVTLAFRWLLRSPWPRSSLAAWMRHGPVGRGRGQWLLGCS